jgi:signal transduction histidine kinase
MTQAEVSQAELSQAELSQAELSQAEVSQDVYRSLFDSAPDAILALDMRGRIALCNPEAERLFGYSAQEMLGRPVHAFVPQAGAIVGNGDFGPRVPMAGMRKDGSAFSAELSLASVAREGVFGSVATVRNVSDRIDTETFREGLRIKVDRERLESQLHQSQRYESLGQLAGGVAHDFNNLLGAVVNYAEFVKEDVQRASEGDFDSDWAQVLHDIEQIERNADRAATLTHQLLAFARRVVVHPQVVNLNEIVKGIDQLLQESVGRDVDVLTSLAPDLWQVEIDKGQFEQVLVNLAVNAADAMPGGGRLSVDTENIVVDEDYAASSVDIQPGRHVRLRVSDTGEGMDNETLKRAFEPFFTTKPAGEGPGLGLATVYGIVTQAGGSVQIYSEPGVGTTISALLPTFEDAVARSSAPRVATRRGTERGRVLVVEDSESVREVTNRILVRNGYEVIEASNGPEALEILAGFEGKIDLLLTDVIMPQMMGEEVAQRIRARRPGVRVLYMSGYTQGPLSAQGVLAPGASLIEKPFSEPSLLATISNILTRPAG